MLPKLEKAERLGGDCYVTFRKWGEETQEQRNQGKEEAEAIVSNFANSPLQKGAEVAHGNKESKRSYNNGNDAKAG
ncbi:MAG: hypothetical protein OEW82_02740 [Dehalococcoidia bacterium]|nr:hypothetical protein [Dehalococcoidia bacterium]